MGKRTRSAEVTRPSLFWPLAAIVLPLAGYLAKIRIRGNLPREGAYVLAPNHYSELDPVFVAAATWYLGRAPRFMAKSSLFRVPVLGWVLRATGMIPIERAGSATTMRAVFDAAEELVEHGRGVIVYPEGTLTRDPDLWPMRGKTGAVRLALTGGLPLIPMAQWGTQRIFGRYAKRISLWPPRKPVDVLVGEPIDLGDLRDLPEREALQIGTERLMQRISELLGELRGQTPPERIYDPGSERGSGEQA